MNFTTNLGESNDHCPYLSCLTCDNGLQLILSVKKHPELYDINHYTYYCSVLKEKVWDSIAKELNSSTEECRNAWATLCAAYYCAMTERKEMEKNGKTEGLSRTKWKFEEEMSFLAAITNENTLNSNVDKPKEKSSLELFFEAMRETVRSFSPENQIIAKTQIFTAISDLELREIDVKDIADMLNDH